MYNTHTVCGLTFRAVRYSRPIPHWRLQTPSGSVCEPGTAGLKGTTRKALWASLEDIARRAGAERVLAEWSTY